MATDFSPEILDQLLAGGHSQSELRGSMPTTLIMMTWRSGRATPSHFIRKLPFNSFFKRA